MLIVVSYGSEDELCGVSPWQMFPLLYFSGIRFLIFSNIIQSKNIIKKYLHKLFFSGKWSLFRISE
jgi:hypothetical protein